VDEQFGRILQCLKDEGLEGNTIVVFTSDHGEMMGSQGRMYKSVWYEESLGIPFLIRWPGRIRPGREDLLLSVPDVMPTLLGLMGLERHIPSQVEGADYSGILLRRQGHRPASAIYLNHDPGSPELGARGVRTLRYTYVIDRTVGGEERYLFDNLKDPYQMRNLIGAKPALEKELQAEVDVWLERTGDPWRKRNA
jgi:arylsulfatase A-like enzyme